MAQSSIMRLNELLIISCVALSLVALTGLPEPGLRQRLAQAPLDLAPQAQMVVASVPADTLAQRPDMFDGGRRAASVAAARARYDESIALYQARVRQAVREVEQALVALQSTAERAADAASAQAGYQSWLNATEARYQAGLASLVELEDARRIRLAAADALVALQLERIQAWIDLYRAAGGGWTSAATTAQP